MVVDVQQQILLAQQARQEPGSDVRSLPGLLDVAGRCAPILLVLADVEFDSEANHEHIRQRLGARSIIPARRRGSPPQRVPAFHCAAVGRFPSYSAIPCSRKFRL